VTYPIRTMDDGPRPIGKRGTVNQLGKKESGGQREKKKPPAKKALPNKQPTGPKGNKRANSSIFQEDLARIGGREKGKKFPQRLGHSRTQKGTRE